MGASRGSATSAESYGVLERVTIIACPKRMLARKRQVTKQVKRKPGASPLLFGKFLMELGAFVSLEDISSELPAYREEVIGVDMDEPLAKAYADLEKHRSKRRSKSIEETIPVKSARPSMHCSRVSGSALRLR